MPGSEKSILYCCTQIFGEEKAFHGSYWSRRAHYSCVWPLSHPHLQITFSVAAVFTLQRGREEKLGTEVLMWRRAHGWTAEVHGNIYDAAWSPGMAGAWPGLYNLRWVAVQTVWTVSHLHPTASVWLREHNLLDSRLSAKYRLFKQRNAAQAHWRASIKLERLSVICIFFWTRRRRALLDKRSSPRGERTRVEERRRRRRGALSSDSSSSRAETRTSLPERSEVTLSSGVTKNRIKPGPVEPQRSAPFTNADGPWRTEASPIPLTFNQKSLEFFSLHLRPRGLCLGAVWKVVQAQWHQTAFVSHACWVLKWLSSKGNISCSGPVVV